MPENDLDLLREAALAAGKIAERHFKNGPETWDKGQGLGPVTEADLEIDRMLKAELTSARPDYGWLSEESEDNSDRQNAEFVFIVDPIDGTRSFINGHTTFAHSLAIAKNGRTVAAVVYLPMRDELFEAGTDQASKLNGQNISHSAREQLAGASVLAAKPMMVADKWPGGVPPVDVHFRSSLAFRMCLIAQGRFDAMLTLRDSWEWDIAAGDLICRQAGVHVTDRNDQPLVFNNLHPQTAGVVAAPQEIHRGLVRHLG